MISIIVPVYNVEKYLPRCIESILNQTYKDLEIILVDDGSPDRCGQICDDYAQKDSRIRVIHKENAGLSSARNAGLGVASGEYLMFVDSDDYISADAAQVLQERMLQDGSDMVIGKHINTYDNEETDGEFCEWMTDAVLSKQDVFSQLGERNYYALAAWCKLYRKGLFDNLRYPPLSCGEDVWTFPQIIEKCRKISVVDKTVYSYYQRADSIMHVRSERIILDDLKAVLSLSRFLWEKGFEKSARRWFAIGIDKTMKLKNKQNGRTVFKDIFSTEERKMLLHHQTRRTRLKWLFLYVPLLYTAVTLVKHLFGRRNV